MRRVERRAGPPRGPGAATKSGWSSRRRCSPPWIWRRSGRRTRSGCRRMAVGRRREEMTTPAPVLRTRSHRRASGTPRGPGPSPGASARASPAASRPGGELAELVVDRAAGVARRPAGRPARSPRGCGSRRSSHSPEPHEHQHRAASSGPHARTAPGCGPGSGTPWIPG